MKILRKNNLKLLQFDNLHQNSFVHHCISTRKGGVSPAPFNQLNVGFGVGDLSANVIENRNRICDAIGASTKQFVAMKQGHTTNIYVIKNKHSIGGFSNINDSLKNIDALITNLSNITLFTYSADCALSLFYDSNNHAIAVVHSGWRGALSNIYSNVLQRMVLEYGTKTKELFVGISPMISCEFYDVT